MFSMFELYSQVFHKKPRFCYMKSALYYTVCICRNKLYTKANQGMHFGYVQEFNTSAELQ